MISSPHKDVPLSVSIGKNTIFGVLARLTQVGTRLITVPVVIAHLGLGGYGIWAIIMTAGAYMRFGSIGIKSAFQKYVAESTGNANYQRANELLSTGSAAMLLISVLGLIPISLLSRVLAKAAGVPPEFLSSAAHAISMLALIMVLSNFGAAFEAIIIGGHRIDIARKLTTIFTVAEAVGIILVLRLGFGLFAMAAVMGLSEVGFVSCCYVISKKVVPQIRVSWKYVTKSSVHELFRYAATYQLVNIMEVVYGAIVPVTLLRVFGDEAAGVFALANRLTSSALMLPDAFLLPILSGAAKVHSSGSANDMQRLIGKAFKVSLVLSLLPLAFIAIFGSSIIYAWTGQTRGSFQITLVLLCINSFFYSFSLLGLVLYRSSGNALYDNIRQALRIVLLLTISLFANRIGFLGVLSGLAASEMIGMVFMTVAIARIYPGFRIKTLLPHTVKVIFAAAVSLAAGIVLSHVPLHFGYSPRLLTATRVTLAVVGCAVAALPALWLTKSVNTSERRALLQVLFPGRFRPVQPLAVDAPSGS
jgi:O-antigen/teichoic acid export membrane protein